MTEIKQILIVDLHPHPKNPRLSPRTEVIDMIASQLGKEMDEAHALIVRPNADGYEIISGHHRKLAAEKAGLRKVPCWVREMTDTEAYMALVQNNAQGELEPLEIGLHCLSSGLAVEEYARKIGIKPNTLSNWKRAAEVASVIPGAAIGKFLSKHAQLTEIHRVPKEDWANLAKEMLQADWSFRDTRAEVEDRVARAKRKSEANKRSPAERKQQQRHVISLDEWKEMDGETRKTALAISAKAKDAPSFNKQEGPDIEWAQWSWNPITGCLHDCPYCYARDIAKQKKMSAVYPYGFEPAIHPLRLLGPQSTKVPKQAMTDERFKNVFTGSMADIFGRWVPAEWIEAVLTQVRAAPQWNFLFLTKFPGRMAEFDFPKNVWAGTSVDLQARVPAAEKAFAKINAKVKWLSVEPMLEPLKFSRLDLFDWIVVGGASKSSKTPEWRPPVKWIMDLHQQAEQAGCKWYTKSNLLGSPSREGLLELPIKAPIPDEAVEIDRSFKYLGKDRD